MNANVEIQLIDYGRMLMAQVAGGEQPAPPDWARKFLDLLGSPTPGAGSAEPLQSILTLIDLHGQRAAPAYLRPVALSLATGSDSHLWVLTPVDKSEALAVDRSALHRQFLSGPAASEQNFERFFHLMRKYASTLPNTYGEPGVSLFEQWKMVAALVCIAGSTDRVPERLGLVGGDIPGIQRVISLVTAKGAAKAMRGRSAFIQLLGGALVQRVLDELELSPANLVYDAGGNFVLLAGWREDLPGHITEIANAINTMLLVGTEDDGLRFDGFHGDLAVALAAVKAPLEALRYAPVSTAGQRTATLWQQAEEQLKHAIAASKQRPFGDLASSGGQSWHDLFDAEPSETDDFCAVCRRQRRDGEVFVRLDLDALDDASNQATEQCQECAGFGELAGSLGHRGARLLIDMQRPVKATGWQQALFAVARRWYSIGERQSRGDIVLALSLDDFPGDGVDGFRLLARTTPMTGNTIMPNDVLAEKSTGGTKRLGILRMDVDNLGELIVRGLPQRTPMATAELSATLERFFAGWLDRICRRIERDLGKGDLFYVLFAGGDDLLAVGPWTAMVPLAQAICKDFSAYASGHPAIHLSAGIAVVGGKAPLYAAADMADEALHKAKKLDEHDPKLGKNAICFLDRAYHWQPFTEVTALQQQLADMVEKRNVPNSLLTTLRAIESRYRQDLAMERGVYGEQPTRNRSGTVKVYFGPWMWRQAYALSRISDRQSDAGVKEDLHQLKLDLLEGRIDDLGLAARWAQWVTRKESNNGDHQ